MALELLLCSISSISPPALQASLGEGNIPFIPCHTGGSSPRPSCPRWKLFPSTAAAFPAPTLLFPLSSFLGILAATSPAAAAAAGAAVPYLRAHDFISSPLPTPRCSAALSELCFAIAVPVTSCSLLCFCDTNSIFPALSCPSESFAGHPVCSRNSAPRLGNWREDFSRKGLTHPLKTATKIQGGPGGSPVLCR